MENGEAALLADGDTLDLHGNRIRVQLPRLPSHGDEENPPGDLLQLIEEGKAGAGAWIEMFRGGEPAGDTPLGDEGSSVLIGRSRECDLVVDDPLRLVSGVHARIEIEWAGAFVYDLSRNGVYVNGRKVDNCASLADGDRVTLALADEQPDGVVLVFRDREGGDRGADAGVELSGDHTKEAENAPSPSSSRGDDTETPPKKDRVFEKKPSSAGDDHRERRPVPPRSGGGGAFFWIVIAVAVLVIAAFAFIGIRLYTT